ncbi:hypothetical protein K439DRAFT_1409883 [Ramaria rubella]|nr:hypothetical protein K439DRAFT_1409883 [Ramaria rubella]
MTSPTAPSPPPSPQAPTLHLPTISRLLMWGAQRRRSSSGAQDKLIQDVCAPVASPSSPTTKRVKSHHIECSSGSELKTHGRIMDAHPECRQSDMIVHNDFFVCLNGVDTKRLLLLARRRVFEKVEMLGGNAIIDERWSCTICKHETRRGIVYRISIMYQGTPARCTLPDPQRPVAMDEVKSVPGLMTVVSRE